MSARMQIESDDDDDCPRCILLVPTWPGLGQFHGHPPAHTSAGCPPSSMLCLGTDAADANLQPPYERFALIAVQTERQFLALEGRQAVRLHPNCICSRRFFCPTEYLSTGSCSNPKSPAADGASGGLHNIVNPPAAAATC